MVNERLLAAFFEDLAQVEDGAGASARALIEDDEVPIWTEHPEAVRVLRSVLTSPEQVEAFSELVAECVHTALHSALVAIDGGAASARVGRVDLVDLATSESLGEGLHESYVGYLFEMERME